ncbi:MAG TPA: hypothetical protein VK993_00745 [Chthoniobacterales bacterium]|nr:hypothetical protein [Chthoniobacterales bacterium]
MHRGSSQTPLAENDNWKADPRSEALQRDYPDLVPANDKESALMLTLTPGRYTMHGTNVDGAEWVLLLEAYDVDSLKQ